MTLAPVVLLASNHSDYQKFYTRNRIWRMKKDFSHDARSSSVILWTCFGDWVVRLTRLLTGGAFCTLALAHSLQTCTQLCLVHFCNLEPILVHVHKKRIVTAKCVLNIACSLCYFSSLWRHLHPLQLAPDRLPVSYLFCPFARVLFLIRRAFGWLSFM